MTATDRRGANLHRAAAVPAAALPAWRELQQALVGVIPPCRSDPPAWFDREDSAPAIRACQHCPARTPCHHYATEAREPAGVWGGRQRERARGDTTSTTTKPRGTSMTEQDTDTNDDSRRATFDETIRAEIARRHASKPDLGRRLWPQFSQATDDSEPPDGAA